MTEFRFAIGILKVPVILCVVGAGNEWKTLEIKMLALTALELDFQTKKEQNFNTLLSAIKSILGNQINKSDNIRSSYRKTEVTN